MNPNEVTINARRLVGYATTFAPEQVIDELEPFSSLGADATNFVVRQAANNSTFINSPLATGSNVILVNGINDIYSIVRHASAKLEGDDLINTLKQPATIKTVAKHARFREKVLRSTLSSNLTTANPDEASIVVDPITNELHPGPEFFILTSLYTEREDRGCPLAIENSEGKLDPLFTSFTVWASELSVRSLINKTYL
jgi:hypothetical protein